MGYLRMGRHRFVSGISWLVESMGDGSQRSGGKSRVGRKHYPRFERFQLEPRLRQSLLMAPVQNGQQ